MKLEKCTLFSIEIIKFGQNGTWNVHISVPIHVYSEKTYKIVWISKNIVQLFKHLNSWIFVKKYFLGYVLHPYPV